MPPRQTKPKDLTVEDDVEAKAEIDKTAKEVNDEWELKTLTAKPVALDTSLNGIVKLVRKNLDAAIVDVDSAYLAIYPTSLNNKDGVLTVLGDVREDLANAVLALGGLG